MAQGNYQRMREAIARNRAAQGEPPAPKVPPVVCKGRTPKKAKPAAPKPKDQTPLGRYPEGTTLSGGWHGGKWHLCITVSQMPNVEFVERCQSLHHGLRLIWRKYLAWVAEQKKQTPQPEAEAS